MRTRLGHFIGVLATLFARNWLTLLGATIVTATALTIVAFFVISLSGGQQSPYTGIMAFLILPAIFVVGLLLIPLGAWIERRKRARLAEARHEEPPHIQIDLNQKKTREAVGIIAFLTVVNFAVLSVAMYRGTEHMESVEFCGKTCHDVMEPEFTAHQIAPHSEVTCVECHVGPGISGFIQAKLAGVEQVFEVALGTYPTPIPTPVHNLPPAELICVDCHEPTKAFGDVLKVTHSYAEDEANTRLTTALTMHVGGSSPNAKGIHGWHLNPDREVLFHANEDRSEIPFVRVKEPDGTVTEYVAADAEIDPTALNEADLRRMDCHDCHNRPAHTFSPPANAVDRFMESGRIDPALPYIKQVALATLKDTEAIAGDPARIGDIVRAKYEDVAEHVLNEHEALVAQAIDGLKTIYTQNVFPKMNVTWGTYPNHSGHTDYPGCFRCHTDSHESSAGDVIRQDCMMCHAVLAWEEESPEILQTLQLQ